MYLLRCFPVHGRQHFVKIFRPFFLRSLLKRPAAGVILRIFRKVNIIQDRLDVKASASCNNGDFPPAADIGNGLLRHFLEGNHIKLVLRFQDIDQMMGNALHF